MKNAIAKGTMTPRSTPPIAPADASASVSTRASAPSDLARAGEERRARTEARAGRDDRPTQRRDVRADPTFGAVRPPEIGMTHRFVGRAEKRFGLACGARVVSLQRAARDHDEHREPAEREGGATGEARSEDREQQHEGCELQHGAQLREHALRDGLLHIRDVRRQRRDVRNLRPPPATLRADAVCASP